MKKKLNLFCVLMLVLMAEKIYSTSMDDLIFGLFCLIMAEVFAIGLKLKEAQDLTI